jgi:hypothetical protein
MVNFKRLASILCAALLLPSALLAAPKQKEPPPVETSVASDVQVKVLRGGTCEIPLQSISSYGYEVKFEVVSQPRFGSLSIPQRKSNSSVSFFYTHDGKKSSTKDSFRFKCKSGPQNAWGYAKAAILIEEPPARFRDRCIVARFPLSFPRRVANASASDQKFRWWQVARPVKVAPPWSIDHTDISLAEGEVQNILITFQPVSTDTQRGSLVFESGPKPFPEIPLAGAGQCRFQVPDKLAFEQRVGVDVLNLPVKNQTTAPLPISIECAQPLEAPDSIVIPPESSQDLVLRLPARPFAEKMSS